MQKTGRHNRRPVFLFERLQGDRISNSIASYFKTEKLPVLTSCLFFIVSLIGPDIAPVGTRVVIVVLFFSVNGEGTPLNVNALTPPKFGPVIVTDTPSLPEIGKMAIVFTTGFIGCGANPGRDAGACATGKRGLAGIITPGFGRRGQMTPVCPTGAGGIWRIPTG